MDYGTSSRATIKLLLQVYPERSRRAHFNTLFFIEQINKHKASLLMGVTAESPFRG
jgi:hypothetical protein